MTSSRQDRARDAGQPVDRFGMWGRLWKNPLADRRPPFAGSGGGFLRGGVSDAFVPKAAKNAAVGFCAVAIIALASGCVSPHQQRPETATAIERKARFVVLFDVDSKKLDKTSHWLASQAAEEALHFDQPVVILTGYADRAGSQDYNRALSVERAMAVLDVLSAKGVDAKHVEVIGVGENDLAIATKDGVFEAANRRVEILVTGRKADRKAVSTVEPRPQAQDEPITFSEFTTKMMAEFDEGLSKLADHLREAPVGYLSAAPQSASREAGASAGDTAATDKGDGLPQPRLRPMSEAVEPPESRGGSLVNGDGRRASDLDGAVQNPHLGTAQTAARRADNSPLRTTGVAEINEEETSAPAVLRIEFAPGSAELDGAQRETLQELVNELESPETAELKLFAYANDSGLTESQALGLSYARAIAVRRALLEQGVQQVVIDLRPLTGQSTDVPSGYVDVFSSQRPGA